MSTLELIAWAALLLLVTFLLLTVGFMTWPGGGTQRTNPDQFGDEGEERKPGDGF